MRLFYVRVILYIIIIRLLIKLDKIIVSINKKLSIY